MGPRAKNYRPEAYYESLISKYIDFSKVGHCHFRVLIFFLDSVLRFVIGHVILRGKFKIIDVFIFFFIYKIKNY